MKILHLDHGSAFGGAERSLIELASAQRTLGHEPQIASGVEGRFADQAASEGFDVSVLGWSGHVVGVPQQAGPWTLLATLPDIVRAASLLRSHVAHADPDVVHVHTRKAQLISALALAGRSVPVVWHLRDDPPARRVVRAAVRLCLRRADHAVAISQWMIRAYADDKALPRTGRIGLVPSGISIDDLVDLPTPWLDGTRQPIVGYIGQIARRKGPDLLVSAAARLTDVRAVTFLLIGDVSFPRSEGAFGRELATSIAASSVGGSVRWVPATPGPRAAFEQIDILACPSRVPEPLGRVLVEAMASRRPIVTAKTGAAVDLLDAKSAVLIDRPDADDLATGIRHLIDDVAFARGLTEHARPRAQAFDPVVVARQMDIEYASIIRRRS